MGWGVEGGEGSRSREAGLINNLLLPQALQKPGLRYGE